MEIGLIEIGLNNFWLAKFAITLIKLTKSNVQFRTIVVIIKVVKQKNAEADKNVVKMQIGNVEHESSTKVT